MCLLHHRAKSLNTCRVALCLNNEQRTSCQIARRHNQKAWASRKRVEFWRECITAEVLIPGFEPATVSPGSNALHGWECCFIGIDGNRAGCRLWGTSCKQCKRRKCYKRNGLILQGRLHQSISGKSFMQMREKMRRNKALKRISKTAKLFSDEMRFKGGWDNSGKLWHKSLQPVIHLIPDKFEYRVLLCFHRICVEFGVSFQQIGFP